MNEVTKLKKENEKLIDLLNEVIGYVKLMIQTQKELNEKRDRLFDLEIKNAIHNIKDDAGYNWRYNDVCLCLGKIYSENGVCQGCGKKVNT